MSCGYSTRYKLKHIVISNNIFSTLYSIFIVFALVFFARVFIFLRSLLLFFLSLPMSLVVWRFGYLCVYANVGTAAVDYLIWIHGIGAVRDTQSDLSVVGRLVVIRPLSSHTQRKLFPSSAKKLNVLLAFFWGKLNKLCVDSGLCRCVSREKKNAVLCVI